MRKKFDNTIIYIEKYKERPERAGKNGSRQVRVVISPRNIIPFLKKNINKRNIFFIGAALVVALSIPMIFAGAANTNEVTNSKAIVTSAAEIASPPPSAASPIPVSTDGQITSVLTDNAVQAAPTPTPAFDPSPAASSAAPSAVSPAAPSAVSSAVPSAVSPAAPSAVSSAVPSAEQAVAAASDSAAADPEAGYTVMSPGESDPFVAMIQQRLMDLFYMDQDEPTTLYGPATTQAVKDFQRVSGLAQDGISSLETQTLLFSPAAHPYIVVLGDLGPDVESIQDRLAELGYAVQSTGTYDEDTQAAVKKFQSINSLSDDGSVGNETRQVLFSQDALPASAKTGSTDSSRSVKTADAGSPAAAPANPNKVEAFISAAMAEVGKPYVLGGKGPNVFDCSGLVYYALKASGNGIGYMTSYDWADAGQYARISSMKDLQRGDVVCESGHVGIYLGDGQIVNASSSNGQVIVSTNVFGSNYWVGHFICGRRPLS